MDKEAIKQRHINYKLVFNTEQGEKVLKDLKDFCYYNKSTYTGNKDECIYKEGMRNVVLYILTQLKSSGPLQPTKG